MKFFFNSPIENPNKTVYENCHAGCNDIPLNIVARPPIVINILFNHNASTRSDELVKPHRTLAIVLAIPYFENVSV